MPSIPILSPSDIRFLKDMKRAHVQRNQNRGNVTRAPFNPQSPDTYLARPGGDQLLHDSIPVDHDSEALNFGSGLPAFAGGVPGSAECEIYRPGGEDGLSAPVAMGFTINPVLNYSTSVITQEYIPITREKSGRWIAISGGGGEGGGANWIIGTTTSDIEFDTDGIINVVAADQQLLVGSAVGVSYKFINGGTISTGKTVIAKYYANVLAEDLSFGTYVIQNAECEYEYSLP